MPAPARISQLPARDRLAVLALYLIALALAFTGVTIAYLRGFSLGVGLGLGLETLLILDLVRRGLSCS